MRRRTRTSTARRAWSPTTAACVELRTIKPARLPGARHRRLVAPAAHPFLGVGPGLAVAPGDADVLSRASRSTSSDAHPQRDPRRRGARAAASRASCRRPGPATRSSTSTSSWCAAARPRPAHAVSRLIPTGEMTLGPFFPREFAAGRQRPHACDGRRRRARRSRSPAAWRRTTASRSTTWCSRSGRPTPRGAIDDPGLLRLGPRRHRRQGVYPFKTIKPGAIAGPRAARELPAALLRADAPAADHDVLRRPRDDPVLDAVDRGARAPDAQEKTARAATASTSACAARARRPSSTTDASSATCFRTGCTSSRTCCRAARSCATGASSASACGSGAPSRCSARRASRCRSTISRTPPASTRAR